MAVGEQASYTLREIIERFGGEVLGDGLTRVSHVGTLENATAHSVAFLTSERYLEQLKTTRAGAVILGSALRESTSLPRIVCGNPYLYFARVSALLNPPRPPIPGIHPSAIVDPSAAVDEGRVGARWWWLVGIAGSSSGRAHG
jgi:UDP-3-O-[3-hydroxymyristoyl] glucosamine N-acyltransferase